jgi:alpha-galactosidase
MAEVTMKRADAIRQIETTPGHPTWILQTEQTAYVFGLDPLGRLAHLYWGPWLPQESDYGKAQVNQFWPFERAAGVAAEEYTAWGDVNYFEPGIKATFADGVRAVELAYAAAQVDEDAGRPRLIVTLRDCYYPLSVHLHYRVVAEYDLIERYVVVENQGETAIVLEQVMSALWCFPLRDRYRLRTLVGKWGAETQLQENIIVVGKQIVESRKGHTSHSANPWFGLDAGMNGEGAATETQGEVWFGALAYSGNWKFAIERDSSGQTTLAGGIHDFDFRWQLDAGEHFATPTFVGGYSNCGYGEASRHMHGFQLEYVLPKPFAHQPRPVLYNSWYATLFDVNMSNQVAAAERAAKVGVELFVVDDGWFGARKNDQSGLGDWWVDRDKFPEGLNPLIERVNELGMDFGIWVEPEMVNPDSDLYRAHPDWVYHFPNRQRTEQRNQLVLNFGREDVQEFILNLLDKLLADYPIKFIKWDMNRPFSEPGWPDAPAGRERELWVRHTWGLYRILDELRARHPDVLFESCSGGGGRVDLGILQRTDQVWTSDNTDPSDYLLITEGFSMAYVTQTRMMWVTDSQYPNNRLPPLRYRFHTAMTGTLGVGSALAGWSAAEMEEARTLIALYKEIRATVQQGQLYRLRSPRSSELAAVQYVHRDGSQAALFCFLHSSRFGPVRAWVQLQGLESLAHYRVEGLPVERPPHALQEAATTTIVLSGAALMQRGLYLSLRGDYQSLIVRLFREE